MSCNSSYEEEYLQCFVDEEEQQNYIAKFADEIEQKTLGDPRILFLIGKELMCRSEREVCLGLKQVYEDKN